MPDFTLEQVRAVVKEELHHVRKLAESTDRAIRGENGHPGIVTVIETTKKDVAENTKDIGEIKQEQNKRKIQLRSALVGVAIALIGVIGKYLFN